MRERKLNEEVEDAVADVAHYACLLLDVEYLYVNVFESKTSNKIVSKPLDKIALNWCILFIYIMK